MLSVHHEKWDQTAQDILHLSVHSIHHRSRERFLALYEIINGKTATKVSEEIGRNKQTVMEWVHRYNRLGEGGIIYKHTGGRQPFFVKNLEKPLKNK